MVSASAAISALAVAVLATSTRIDAHGTLAKPGLKFTGSGYGGNFYALVPMNALKPLAGDIFANYPDANKNAAAFGRAFKAQTQYKTFKDFIFAKQDLSKGRTTMPKTAACGFTDPTGGTVQQLPAQLEWYGGVMNHPGPCEVWCDNTIAVPFTENCAQKYPQGKIAYDKAACTGKSRLTLYWMSTLLEWQVYTNCAKIGAGSRSLDFDEVESSAVYNATAYEATADEEAADEARAQGAIADEYDLGNDEDETGANADSEITAENEDAEIMPDPEYNVNADDEEITPDPEYNTNESD